MGEVEAEAIGSDQRTCLPSVLAEHAVQRGVEQVGGGVVAHDVPAPAGVDGRARLVALARMALGDAAEVDDQPSDRLAHILNGDLPARLAQ